MTDDDLPFDIRDAMRKRSLPAPDLSPADTSTIDPSTTDPSTTDPEAVEVAGGDGVAPQKSFASVSEPSLIEAMEALRRSEARARKTIERTEKGDRGGGEQVVSRPGFSSEAILGSGERLPLGPRERSSGVIKIIAIAWNGGTTQSIHTLFKSFPKANDVAYLVVQSVNSRYQTLDAKALNETTSLRVEEAKNGVRVAAGYVYLVPFLHAVTVKDGCIRLREIRVSWSVVQNYASKFFESVANEAREKGVGIVLANDLRAANEPGGRSVADFERCGGVESIMRNGGKIFFEDCAGNNLSPQEVNDLIPRRRSAKDIAAYLASLDQQAINAGRIDGAEREVERESVEATYQSASHKNTLDSIVNTILLDVDQQDRKDHRFFLYSLIYRRMGYLQVNSLQQYFYFVSHSVTEREQLSELVARRWGKPGKTGRGVKPAAALANADPLSVIEGEKKKKYQVEVEALKQQIRLLEAKNNALESDNHKLLRECSEVSCLNQDLIAVQASMGCALLVLDKNLYLRRFNAAATKLFDLLPSDVGKPLLQLPSEIKLMPLEDRCKQVLLNRKVLFVDEIINDGLWCLRLAPYLDESDVMVGVVISWADRETFQYWHHRIHSHESRLEVVLNNAGIGIVGIDLDGVLIKANDAVAQMLGYERNGLYGVSYDDVIHPDDLVESNKLMQDILTGEQSVFHREIRYVRRDKKIIAVRVTCSLLEGQDKSRQVLAMVEDITEQTRLARQLQQSQKMEALGQLTGGIAHDFNNLLAVIMGHTELARSQLVRPESEKELRLKRYLDAVQKSADRAKVLISQMLIFSHGGKSAPQSVHPSALVQEVVAIFESSLPSNIELKIEIAPQVPAIMIDPVQADQMILNLCLNARDAIEGAGEIVISVSRIRNLATECASCHRPVVGDYVEICVRDSGVGICPELQGKVFDPFFSTKQVGKGSGLGLSVVHGIVHDHKAHVGLHSVSEQGACFKLWFPVLEPLAAEAAPAAWHRSVEETFEPESLFGSGRVMVVDDEPSLLSFLEELLVSRGYSVVPFSKARQAQRYLEGFCDELDLVITDHAMPEISGLELAAALYQRRPELPVIVYTGSDHDGYYDSIPSPSIKQFLTKPVRPAELLRALKRHILKAL